MEGERIGDNNEKKSFNDFVFSYISINYLLRKKHLSDDEGKRIKASLLRKTLSDLRFVAIILIVLGFFYFFFDLSQGLFISPSYTSPGLAVAGESLLAIPSILLLVYVGKGFSDKKDAEKRNRAVLFVYYLTVLGASFIFMYKDFLYLASFPGSIYSFSVFFFTIFSFFPDFFLPEILLLDLAELAVPPFLVLFSHASWEGFYQIPIIGLVCVLGSFFIMAKNAEREVLSLENEKAKETLEETSSIDQLTKAYNRYVMIKDYSRILHLSAKTSSKTLNLFMIDIDKFKEYNDAFSHVQGDVCLSLISRCLINILSEKGLRLYRYGGEEFIVMYLADSDQAIALGERLREAVIGLKIDNPPTVPSRKYLTISIGIASIKLNECPCLEKFISATDEQLYKSKESGRDAVFFNGSKITAA